MPSSCCRELKHCMSACRVMSRMPVQLRHGWKSIPWFPGSIIPDSPATRIMPGRKNICRKERVPSSVSVSRAVCKPARPSSTTSSFFRILPMSAMPSRWLFTPHPPLISSFPRKNSSPTGVTADFIRLSVGIECIDDILADISRHWKLRRADPSESVMMANVC